MLEISKTFGFEAAHVQPTAPPGHPNARVHGHSFVAEVTLEGHADGARGMIRDFGEVEAAAQAVRERLDHRFLNDVEGLGAPTLENLSRWIYDAIKPALPELSRVTVSRPALGQSCTYRP